MMIETAHFIRLTESPVGGSGEAAEGSDEEEDEEGGGRSIHVSSGPDSFSLSRVKRPRRPPGRGSPSVPLAVALRRPQKQRGAAGWILEEERMQGVPSCCCCRWGLKRVHDGSSSTCTLESSPPLPVDVFKFKPTPSTDLMSTLLTSRVIWSVFTCVSTSLHPRVVLIYPEV